MSMTTMSVEIRTGNRKRRESLAGSAAQLGGNREVPDFVSIHLFVICFSVPQPCCCSPRHSPPCPMRAKAHGPCAMCLPRSFVSHAIRQSRRKPEQFLPPSWQPLCATRFHETFSDFGGNRLLPDLRNHHRACANATRSGRRDARRPHEYLGHVAVAQRTASG